MTAPSQPVPPAPPAGWRYLAGLVGLAAAYYLTAKAGLLLPQTWPSVTLIWPPAGIAVAVLFRGGVRYWPGVLVAAAGLGAGADLGWAAAGTAAGDTLGPVAAALALRRSGFDPGFGRRRDVTKFVVFGAAAGAAVSAANGTAWLCRAGAVPWGQYPEAAAVWWLGDAVGVLTFGLPLVTWAPGTWAGYRRRGEAAGLGLALAGAAAVGVVCLGPPLGDVARKYPLWAAPCLLTLWVTVRYRVWAGSTCVAVLAAAAAWGAGAGRGPFAPADGFAGLLLVCGYVGVLGVGVLVLTAVTAERDAAEARLAASEELYRRVVEDNPAMICRLAADGTVVFANETYAAAVGPGPPAPVGRRFLADYQPEDRARAAAALAGLAPGGPAAVVEVLAPGGQFRWHKWTVRATGPAGGRPAGFQAVGLDVTDRKRAEADRRAIEDRMVRAQKLDSLGVVAGGIAHEFNNLLTAILGHAELAAEAVPAGSPARAHLGRVADAGGRAADLVRRLRAYAGAGPVAARPVDLNEVVRDTVGLAAGAVPKTCRLTVEAAPGLPPVVADEAQLRQVVLNLLVNAGEAVGDRPGAVTVSTAAAAVRPGDPLDVAAGGPLAPGAYVRLRVADTGPGMDPATRARAFDPFFSTKFAGRGLGLAAVHGIVRAHKGAVEVDSDPGAGAVFTVLLPAAGPVGPSDPTPDPFADPLPRRR